MLSLTELLPIIGYTGIVAIIFAESGLLIGFFLPGDSLLFTAGFLASQGFFHIVPLILLSILAAIFGDSVGYAFGHRVGRKIFKREDSILFHKDNLLKAEAFYEKHGGKAIILARFMPVIRTFAPILAGVGTMKYSKFLGYNIVGGVLWAAGLPFLGYFLGNTIPDVDKYLLPIIIFIILLSISPSLIHILRTKEDRERLLKFAHQGWMRIVGK